MRAPGRVLRRPAAVFAAMLLAVLSASCASVSMDVPAEFLRLGSQERSDVRAVTADGARIWVREFAVDDAASLGFWADALVDDLESARGYRIDDRGEVRDGEDHEGRWFAGSTVIDGEDHGYLVALFLVPGGMFSSDRVRTVEFTARRELYEAHLEAVRAAIATVR